jgi:hypothetical protein
MHELHEPSSHWHILGVLTGIICQFIYVLYDYAMGWSYSDCETRLDPKSDCSMFVTGTCWELTTSELHI